MLSGRFEHEMQLEQKAIEGLEGFPPILRSYYSTSAGSQKTTKNVNLNHVKRFFTWLDEQGFDTFDKDLWTMIDVDVITAFFDSIKVRLLKDGTRKPVKYDSIKGVYFALNKFFNFLVKRKIIEESPMIDLEDLQAIVPKEKTEHKVVAMTYDEMNKVVQHIREHSLFAKRDECLFMLGCYSGLRAQALSEVDVDDFDFDHCTLEVIEKGHHERTIRLDEHMIALVKAYLAERGEEKTTSALFLRNSENGEGRERITAKTIEKMIRKHTQGLDKHITPHKMRVTCITNTYLETGDIYAAADRAGHGSVSVTTRYIDNRRKQEKVARLMGDKMFSHIEG